MQLLIINGSPRKSKNTFALLNALKEGADNAGLESELIHLVDYDIRPCTGCEICYQIGVCNQEDQFQEVYQKMLDADAIVIGSPNYIDNVTAQVKALFDRMGDTIHCQLFAGKYVGAVATAGGSMADDVASYINRILYKMGADIVGQISINMVQGEEAFKQVVGDSYALGIRIADAVITEEIYTDQKSGHKEMQEWMKQLILSRRETWIYEYDFYIEKGWL